MMFLKVSLNVLLYIVVMAMTFSIDEKVNINYKWRSAINYHSSNCVVPLHYNLKIILALGDKNIEESSATIYINCPTQNIILHVSKFMSIMEIKLKSANSGIIYEPKYLHDHKEEIVTLDFVEQLLPENNLEYGVYTLYVKFLNLITPSREFLQTWYANEEGDKKLIFATLLQPRRARRFFPCWDEPELSATFNISVEHHIKSKVLSNMPIRGYQSVDDNTMRTLFHTTPQMSTNDVAIIMYDCNNDADELYQIFDSTETVVNMWCRPHLIPHMKFAQYIAGKVTTYLEKNWKMLKSVPKMDYVAIPNFEDKIWQTLGLLFYNEADIIYNEELHPVAHKTVVLRSITDDITYQWIGNLFHPSHWWLNEGFIMFLETYIIDKLFPDSRMMDLFVVQIKHESRHLNNTHSDINYFMEYASDIPKIHSLSLSHIKGAIVWRMLHSVVPHNAFWTSIIAYLNTKFTYFNSRTSDDLWNVMQTTIDELNLETYDLNVKQMMDIWTIQQHYPVLNVIRHYSNILVKISKEFDGKPYFIPVTYTKETDIDFNTYFPNMHYCLTQLNPELEIQFNFTDHWFIVNIQQTGNYRVNYDTKNWQNIARYLNSEKYTNIHVLNRAQIIDDAFHLAIEKKLNFSIFWELASYLSREKDYVAWYPMIKAFEYISNIFTFSSIQYYAFSMILKEAFVKIEGLFEHMEHIEHIYNQSVPTNDDLNKYLKQELAKWGCIINNPLCVEMANHQLQLHLKNPMINKLLPGWQKWTYCNGLKTANFKLWFDVWTAASSIYEKKSDYKMLEFLICSESPDIILNYLKFIIPAYEKINLLKFSKNKIENIDRFYALTANKERFHALTANLFLSALARYVQITATLEEILNNLETIKNSRVSMNAALIVIINNAYTEGQLMKVHEFNIHNNMQQSSSNVEQKIRTRLSEIKNQLNFL